MIMTGWWQATSKEDNDHDDKFACCLTVCFVKTFMFGWLSWLFHEQTLWMTWLITAVVNVFSQKTCWHLEQQWWGGDKLMAAAVHRTDLDDSAVYWGAVIVDWCVQMFEQRLRLLQQCWAAVDDWWAVLQLSWCVCRLMSWCDSEP